MSGSSPWRSSRLVPVLGLVAAMAMSAAGAGVTEATAQPWVPSAPPQPSDLTPAPEPDESARRAIDLVILSQWPALRAADTTAGSWIFLILLSIVIMVLVRRLLRAEAV
jgi:hypothetical protein